jgi:hypothetical protein
LIEEQRPPTTIEPFSQNAFTISAQYQARDWWLERQIAETKKKQKQTGGFRRCAHGRGSSARIWSLETTHCDENAQQNRTEGYWRKNQRFGTLAIGPM